MDVKSIFLIIMGIIWMSFVLIFLLAPKDIAEYTVVDVAFHKTEYRLIGKTVYNFNNISDIERIPKDINGWEGIDFRYPKRVYEVLEADLILSRAYSKNGKIIWVDIINSDRRKSFHDPRVCYGSRWNIVNESIVPIELRNSSVVFDKIYVNRLYLTNKKDPNIKLLVLYWFMFRGGEGVTMVRMSSPVSGSFDETNNYLTNFTRDLLGLVYEKLEKPKSMAEELIDSYKTLGYVIIVLMFLPSIVLILTGLKFRTS